MRPAPGFTIVEALVALVILEVGLLGLVTTAGLVTRMIARGQSATVAAALAHERLERLRAAGCSAPGGGSQTTQGVTVRWETRLPPFPRARAVTVSVQEAARPGGRPDSVTTIQACP